MALDEVGAIDGAGADRGLDALRQHLVAEHGTVRELPVVRRELRRLLVVPRGEESLGWIERGGLRREADESPPIPLAGPPGRQVGIDPLGALRAFARVLVADVRGVDVEPVERVVDAFAHGVLEGVVAVRHEARIVDAAEPARRRELVLIGRAQRRDRDRRAVGERAAGDDRAVVGGALHRPGEHDVEHRRAAVVHHAVTVIVDVVQALREQLGQPHGRTAVVDEAVALVVDVVGTLGAALAGAGDAARGRLGDLRVVEGLDRLARTVVQIAERVDRRGTAAGLAQLQHPLIDVVGARRRRRPGEVPPAPELDVQVGAGESHAARVDVRAMHVLLDQQLRHVVARLRPEHRDRAAVLRVSAGDEEGVAHRVRHREGRREAADGIEEILQRGGGAVHRTQAGAIDVGVRRGVHRTEVGHVRRRVGGGRGRLGVIREVQVVEDGARRRRIAAERRRHRLQAAEVRELAAAALAEDAADERRDGDGVLRPPRRGQRPAAPDTPRGASTDRSAPR